MVSNSLSNHLPNPTQDNKEESMKTQEKKCCEKCFGAFGLVGCKGKSTCPCHSKKPSQTIQEIVEGFLALTEYGKNQPWAIDYIDRIAPGMAEWLRTTLTQHIEGLIKELKEMAVEEGDIGEFSRKGWNAALIMAQNLLKKTII